MLTVLGILSILMLILLRNEFIVVFIIFFNIITLLPRITVDNEIERIELPLGFSIDNLYF